MRILDFARNVEQSGQRFYQEMSSRVQHPGPKDIFSSLASDEKKLLRRLEKFTGLPECRRYDSAALTEDQNVFDQLLRQGDRLQIKEDVDAYQLALDTERQVVEVYEQAIRKETEPGAKRLLQKIVTGEQRELEEIEKVYNFVNAPNENLEWGEFSNMGEFHNFGRDVDK